jgi:Uma2 family endonuclease
LSQTVSEQGKPPTKWQVYEEILWVPYYVAFGRYKEELQVFRLIGGHFKNTSGCALNISNLISPFQVLKPLIDQTY